MSDRPSWERVQALFHEVVDLPAAERRARLDAEAARDGEVARAVERMVDADEDGGTILERPLAGVAGALLQGGNAAAAGRFSPYEIEALIGEGGAGVVFRAVRRDVGGEAAIKVLRDAGLSPARQRRFLAEQRLLARLSHPSIAALHHAGVLDDGTPWFAMELVDGATIVEHCARAGLDLRARIRLFRAACEAVQYLHSHAIIHRDLKPSNILVTAAGHVKLLDFGIAKSLDATDPTFDATRTGLHMMTPAYAAPEQLRGGPVGVHTDVYALGLVLHELLTGDLPYDLTGSTPVEAMAIVARHVAERPSIRARAGGGGWTRADWADLDVLCLKALHADPEQRYRTVDALVRDLDHWLAGEPLEARPDRIGYRARKFVRRHTAAVVAASLAMATLVGLVGFYTVRLDAARGAAEREAERTRRIQGFMLDLFEGGDAEAGPADSLRVVEILERGVLQAEALERDPVVQADLYRTLGGVYQKLGAFDRADSLLVRALRVSTGADADGVEAGGARVALGLLRLDQARLDEAERLVRDGAAALAGAPQAAPAEQAHAALALGRVLEARGDYAAAAAEAEAVLSAAPDALPEEVRLAALGQVADARYYEGRYEVADALNARLLEGVRALHGARHPRVADVLVNLGASRVDRGLYAEAEPFYREAIEILERFHGADHHRTASAMTMLGRALVYQGAFAEGVPLLERALAVQERVNGPVHPRVASALNDLGSAALQEGRHVEAAARFRRMAAIYRAVYDGEHYLLGIAISNLASVLYAQGDHDAAEPLFREAIGIYERTQGAEHLNTGIGRIKLGRVLLRQGRPREATAELLAGYEIVRGQATPSVSWLQSARGDLVAAYEALGETEQAARFRAELEEATPAGGG